MTPAELALARKLQAAQQGLDGLEADALVRLRRELTAARREVLDQLLRLPDDRPWLGDHLRRLDSELTRVLGRLGRRLAEVLGDAQRQVVDDLDPAAMYEDEGESEEGGDEGEAGAPDEPAQEEPESPEPEERPERKARTRDKAVTADPLATVYEKQLASAAAYNADLAKNLTDRAREHIMARVRRVTYGQSRPVEVMQDIQKFLDVPERPQEHFGGLAYQAERIVRTELARTYSNANAAAQERLVALGGTRGAEYVWVHSGSGREPRTNHMALHGTRVPVGGKFQVTGRDGITRECDGPHDPSLPAHETINCRCLRVLWRDYWGQAPLQDIPADVLDRGDGRGLQEHPDHSTGTGQEVHAGGRGAAKATQKWDGKVRHTRVTGKYGESLTMSSWEHAGYKYDVVDEEGPVSAKQVKEAGGPVAAYIERANSVLTGGDRVWRGVSRMELKDIFRDGEIKSENYAVEEREGSPTRGKTFFADYAFAARTFALFPRVVGDRPRKSRPVYIIEVDNSGGDIAKQPGLAGADWYPVTDKAIPASRIARVFEIRTAEHGGAFKVSEVTREWSERRLVEHPDHSTGTGQEVHDPTRKKGRPIPAGGYSPLAAAFGAAYAGSGAEREPTNRRVEREVFGARRVNYDRDGGGDFPVIETPDGAFTAQDFRLGTNSPGGRAARARLAAEAGGTAVDGPKPSVFRIEFQDGVTVTMNAWDGRDVYGVEVSHIFSDRPGSGHGSSIVNALKNHADVTGERLAFTVVANPKFFRRFPWLKQKYDGLEYEYIPREPIQEHPGHPDQKVHGRRGKAAGGPVAPRETRSSLKLGEREREALASEGLMLHGTSVEFASFRGNQRGIVFLSDPSDRPARPTQAEYGADGPFGGRLVVVKVDRSKVKMFDPLNDPEAARLAGELWPTDARPGATLARVGLLPWPEESEWGPALAAAGYTGFRVHEPSVQGESLAVTPKALTVVRDYVKPGVKLEKARPGVILGEHLAGKHDQSTHGRRGAGPRQSPKRGKWNGAPTHNGPGVVSGGYTKPTLGLADLDAESAAYYADALPGRKQGYEGQVHLNSQWSRRNPPAAASLEEGVSAAVANVKGLRRERAVFLDGSGQTYLTIEGNSTSVNVQGVVSPHETEGFTMVHNHPGYPAARPGDPVTPGGTFSPNDIRFAMVMGLREVVAVDTQATYRMRFGRGVTSQNLGQAMRELQAEMSHWEPEPMLDNDTPSSHNNRAFDHFYRRLTSRVAGLEYEVVPHEG